MYATCIEHSSSHHIPYFQYGYFILNVVHSHILQFNACISHILYTYSSNLLFWCLNFAGVLCSFTTKQKYIIPSTLSTIYVHWNDLERSPRVIELRSPATFRPYWMMWITIYFCRTAYSIRSDFSKIIVSLYMISLRPGLSLSLSHTPSLSLCRFLFYFIESTIDVIHSHFLQRLTWTTINKYSWERRKVMCFCGKCVLHERQQMRAPLWRVIAKKKVSDDK